MAQRCQGQILAQRCQGQISTRLSVISGHAQGKRAIVSDVVYEADTAMARPRRFDLPGIPQHVIQRGNNRLPCFLDDGDRRRHLQCLGRALERFACSLHAYVLMSNHVHLLITPEAAGELSRFMHTFSRNYAGLFNGRHGRTGTLWEGRYKACLVDTQAYFLACSRYIELNPVRAWMVSAPGEYRWSSYAANAELRDDPLLAPHPEYLALGASPAARSRAYKALFDEALSEELTARIRAYLQQEKALGSDRFQAWVQERTGRFAGLRPRGRPRKKDR
jgi:putative transposase